MNSKDLLFTIVIVVAVFLITVNFSYTVLETIFSKDDKPIKKVQIKEKKTLQEITISGETTEKIIDDSVPFNVITDTSEEIDIDKGLEKEHSLFNHAIQIDFLVNLVADRCNLSQDHVIEEKRMIMMGLNENYVFIRKTVEIYSRKTLKKFTSLLNEFTLFNKIRLTSKVFEETIEFDFYKKDSKVYSLIINKKPEKLPEIQTNSSGKLSIIVDDMGRGSSTSKEFLDLPPEINLSFLPELSNSITSASLAKRKGHVVMIHVPMETVGKRFKFKNEHGINTAMNAKQLESYMNRIIDLFPMATGINNHMGSKATQSEKTMLPVMRVIKRRNLFFVDSKTTSETLAYKLALKAGIKSAIRTIFLDNTDDEVAIKEMLEYASGAAKANGHSIAICHPHKNTLKAIKSFLKNYNKNDIMLVPITDLIHKEN